MPTFKDYIIKEILSKNDKYFYIKLLKVIFFGGRNKKIVLIYRAGKSLHSRGYSIIAKLLFLRLENKYGIYISRYANIGIGVKFPHPLGIVIGDGCIIGKNVTIYQQVTIGGKIIGDAKNKNYPEIGDNCVCFAGSKLLGNIKIGNSCTIGANAVVLNDVPSHHLAVGIPAKNCLFAAHHQLRPDEYNQNIEPINTLKNKS